MEKDKKQKISPASIGKQDGIKPKILVFGNNNNINNFHSNT